MITPFEFFSVLAFVLFLFLIREINKSFNKLWDELNDDDL